MKRFTVMGFTEAEVGFVVAALFAAIAVASLNDSHGASQEIKELQSKLERTQQDLQRAKEALAKAEKELVGLRKKESTKVPQCWEKGQPREPIADVTVVGDNQYEMLGMVVTIDGVAQMLAAKISLGSTLGCRFVLRARPIPGVDAIAQSTAVWRLRRFFDVDDRPR